jgi:hypothetical protein
VGNEKGKLSRCRASDGTWLVIVTKQWISLIKHARHDYHYENESIIPFQEDCGIDNYPAKWNDIEKMQILTICRTW